MTTRYPPTFWKTNASDHADEISQLKSRIEALEAALIADGQTLRLHLGEMTAQEMRTLRAGFAWVLARAALKQD